MELADSDDKVIYLQRENGIAYLVITYNIFPKGRSIVVLADGASNDGHIQAINKYWHNMHVEPIVLRHRNWAEYLFFIERGSSGKEFTTNIDSKELSDLHTTLDKLNHWTSQGLLDTK